jgi:predicted Zn-dependent protease
VVARARDAAGAARAVVIQSRDLARALARRGASAWVVVERDQRLASIDMAGVTRAEQRTRWRLAVHVDTPAGRGSAHVDLEAADGSADAVAIQAIELARVGIGPAWTSPPPSAPARVDLDDGSLRDPAAGARAALPHHGGVVGAAVTSLREQVTVTTHAGFHKSWAATRVRVDAIVMGGDRSLAIARESRTLDGLGTQAAVTDAVHDLGLFAGAGAPTAGPCTLVLRADAMLDDNLGIWHAFVSQADASIERQGLTRYREHQMIAPGADQLASPLTIASDGALAFGLRSSPVGEEGEAVRRFSLVERGVASGLALSVREAALRGREPNGGVRNLVVEPGSWSGTATGERVVEVRRLRSLSIDPHTGEASLEIALGTDRGVPFTGGSLRLDLIGALAHAQRSTTVLTRGAYVGPDAIWIDRAELIT